MAAGSDDVAAQEACWKCTPGAAGCQCTVAEVMSTMTDNSAGCRSCSYTAGESTGIDCVAKTCTGACCVCSSADLAVASGQPCNADQTSCVTANCMACFTIAEVGNEDGAGCYTAAACPATGGTASTAGTTAPVVALAATVTFLAL